MLPKTVPDFVSVKSSNVKAIGYDRKRSILYVKFLPSDENRDGDVYKYLNVKERVYKNFLDAPSKGIFMHANIKGKYNYFKWSGFGWKKETTLQRRSIQKKRIKKRIMKAKKRMRT